MVASGLVAIHRKAKHLHSITFLRDQRRRKILKQLYQSALITLLLIALVPSYVTMDSSTSIVHLMTHTPPQAKFAPPPDYSSNTSAVPLSSVKNKISLTIGFPTPEITRVGEFHRVAMRGLVNIGNVGEPLLPSRSIRVLIPYGMEVNGVQVFHGREVKLHGSYYVEPAQMPVPLGFENRIEPTLPDERIYNSYTPFPARINSDLLIQSKRGYKILVLNLYPVSYVPAERRLSYFESMTVEVEIGRATTTGGELPQRYSAEDKEEITSIVDNPEAIDTYPQQSSEPLAGESSLDPLLSYQYVIITNEALKNSSVAYNWGDLMARKNSRGITTNIVTTEWIYANYSGVDNQEKIRNFIKDAYTNWGTEYVLLGGCSEIIPPRMFWVQSWSGGYTAIMPTDMYYSCLDGTFNYDGDSY